MGESAEQRAIAYKEKKEQAAIAAVMLNAAGASFLKAGGIDIAAFMQNITGKYTVDGEKVIKHDGTKENSKFG